MLTSPTILFSLQLERKAVLGMLRLIEAERGGETVNRQLLNHLLRMLTGLGIYEDAFQGPFLEQTAQFYAAEGAQVMQQTDVPDYLIHCEVRAGGCACCGDFLVQQFANGRFCCCSCWQTAFECQLNGNYHHQCILQNIIHRSSGLGRPAAATHNSSIGRVSPTDRMCYQHLPLWALGRC